MEWELPWSESLAVGHETLDEEHRRLVEGINDVVAAVNSEGNSKRLGDLLRTLREAAEAHIRQENAILTAIKSGTYEALQYRPRTPHFLKAMAAAAFDEHMAEHQALLARLEAIIDGPVDALCEALKAWFLEHAIKHDAHLKAIFQAM